MQANLKISIPSFQPKTSTGSEINKSSLWNLSHPSICHTEAKQGGKQWQEDCYINMSTKHNRVTISAVFDGHGGYNGMIASTSARKTLYNFFTENQDEMEEWDKDTWFERLQILFTRLHLSILNTFLLNDFVDGKEPTPIHGKNGRFVDSKAVARQSNGDPIHGGTTASITVLVLNPSGKREVYCVNVGDSDVILMPFNGVWSRLSMDHGPDNNEEFNRVQSLPKEEYPIKLLFVYDKSSTFKKYACPLIFRSDGIKDPTFVNNPWGNGLHPTNVRYDPAVYAVTPKEVVKDTTCIAMTRSLGDFYAHQFGLTSTPSINYLELSPNVEYIIAAATDGIWDCWKFEDFSTYLQKLMIQSIDKNLENIVKVALSDTISKAIEAFGIRHYDDASLSLLYIPTSDNLNGQISLV